MELRTAKKDDWLIFYLEGRLDVMLSQQLEMKVLESIEGGERFIIYNLKNVEYMSSSGLRVFISSMRKLKEKDGKIRLCNMSDAVRKILKIVDLENMFEIFASEEQAIKS